jgi:hypothetical protein
MQDRYIGDVGDFGKFGLLRALCGRDGSPLLKFGVVWYRVPDESHNQDGKHLSYLQQSRTRDFRPCDPELYDTLRMLVLDDSGALISERRHTATIETSGLLPKGTVFFSEPLVFIQKNRDLRYKTRNTWLDRALSATACADAVFLDPDNGIECPSIRAHYSKGPKYAFWNEVQAFAERRQSVIIYHHLNHSCRIPEQREKLLAQLNGRLPKDFQTSMIIYRRGTSRAYVFALAPEHTKVLRNRLSEFLTSPWAQHFSP